METTPTTATKAWFSLHFFGIFFISLIIECCFFVIKRLVIATFDSYGFLKLHYCIIFSQSLLLK